MFSLSGNQSLLTDLHLVRYLKPVERKGPRQYTTLYVCGGLKANRLKEKKHKVFLLMKAKDMLA